MVELEATTVNSAFLCHNASFILEHPAGAKVMFTRARGNYQAPFLSAFEEYIITYRMHAGMQRRELPGLEAIDNYANCMQACTIFSHVTWIRLLGTMMRYHMEAGVMSEVRTHIILHLVIG